MEPEPGEITLLLSRLSGGDRAAEDKLIGIVYPELRRLAQHYLRRERPDHSLQATALVHEVYLRLIHPKGFEVKDRAHFFSVAARVMRQILVDHARRVSAAKRGGLKIALDSAFIYTEDQSSQLMELDEALCRLATWDARQAQIVEMRFFGGLSIEEIAQVLDVSTRTVKRDWSLAKAWLYGELSRAVAP